MENPRREIKSRDTKWAQSLAKFVATKTPLTPNSISVLSVFCGLLAFAAYFCYIVVEYPIQYYFILPIIATIGIQSRLICNLIDGMVAIEGGEAAGEARLAVEKRTGRPVITNKNAAQLQDLVTGLIETVNDKCDNQEME